MIAIASEFLADQMGNRLTIRLGPERASMGDVVAGWRDDPAFRAEFNRALAAVEFRAFRWELPPITTATLLDPFECVVLDSPGLDRRPDRAAFAEHWTGGESVVAFPNLGRDAVMVAPGPVGPDKVYTHLGSFVRGAPEAQRDAFWRRVGAEMTARINDRPVWLNTAGAGVAWLRVGLDDRPKYYPFDPYRRPN